MDSELDKLLADILASYVVDGAAPPEIVPVPDMDGEYLELNILVSKRTADVLAKVAEAKGVSLESAARSVLNVIASFVYRSAQSRH